MRPAFCDLLSFGIEEMKARSEQYILNCREDEFAEFMWEWEDRFLKSRNVDEVDDLLERLAYFLDSESVPVPFDQDCRKDMVGARGVLRVCCRMRIAWYGEHDRWRLLASNLRLLAYENC